MGSFSNSEEATDELLHLLSFMGINGAMGFKVSYKASIILVLKLFKGCCSQSFFCLLESMGVFGCFLLCIVLLSFIFQYI